MHHGAVRCRGLDTNRARGEGRHVSALNAAHQAHWLPHKRPIPTTDGAPARMSQAIDAGGMEMRGGASRTLHAQSPQAPSPSPHPLRFAVTGCPLPHGGACPSGPADSAPATTAPHFRAPTIHTQTLFTSLARARGHRPTWRVRRRGVVRWRCHAEKQPWQGVDGAGSILGGVLGGPGHFGRTLAQKYQWQPQQLSPKEKPSEKNRGERGVWKGVRCVWTGGCVRGVELPPVPRRSHVCPAPVCIGAPLRARAPAPLWRPESVG